MFYLMMANDLDESEVMRGSLEEVRNYLREWKADTDETLPGFWEILSEDLFIQDEDLNADVVSIQELVA